MPRVSLSLTELKILRSNLYVIWSRDSDRYLSEELKNQRAEFNKLFEKVDAILGQKKSSSFYLEIDNKFLVSIINSIDEVLKALDWELHIITGFDGHEFLALRDRLKSFLRS